jgi:hypothetical protein
MSDIGKRYFIFVQVPKRYLSRFIRKMEDNPKIGRVLEYDNVWYISEGTEYSKALEGSNPVGNPNGVDPSVLWVGSCEPEDKEEVLAYISDNHAWEVPMIYGAVFDFPYPTREERKKKHEVQGRFKG